jgi:HEAT repeat protein
MSASAFRAAALLLTSSLLLATPAISLPRQESPSPPKAPASSAKNARETAWNLLDTAIESDKGGSRALGVRALGLITGNVHARKTAEHALSDEKPEVRTAAAAALGEMDARASIPKLKHLLSDPEPAVVLAAAHSLEMMHDDAGYQLYYQVLTGERKGSKGLVASEVSTLKDPKQLAELGFEQGIGFIPFGGMGWEAFRMLSKDNATPVRVEAAKVLASDHDEESGYALGDAATGDRNWVVRAAALSSIAKRGNPAQLPAALTAMDDAKPAVRYTAAAAVVRLLDVAHRKPGHKVEQPKSSSDAAPKAVASNH